MFTIDFISKHFCLHFDMQKVVLKQYRDKINQAFEQLVGFSVRPAEGWLRTVRTALGMSGTQLAKRLGVSKARVSKAERDELAGGVTLKTMHSMAQAMNCRFVYAVVPNEKVDQAIKRQAIKKAKQRVDGTSVHMALEGQALSSEQIELEYERIALEAMEKMPADFWDDET